MSQNDLVGGSYPGAGNVIAANGGSGVLIDDGDPEVPTSAHQTFGNIIQGNKIGTDLTGTRDLGNAGDGVTVVTSSFLPSNVTVGGTIPGEGNTIAFNQGFGVSALFGTGNAVQGNDIFANGALGIVTNVNDTLSTYAEARGVALAQGAPVLTGAVFDPQGTVLTGTVTGTPFTRYDLDFFASDAVDPSGFGEGQTYLESISVLVDDTGSASFAIRLDPGTSVGQWISATITGPAGNTSPFSRVIPVVAAVDPSDVQFAAPQYLVTENGTAAVVVVTRTGDLAAVATVAYTTVEGTAKAGTNYTATAGTLTFPTGSASQTVTIPIQDDGIASADTNLQIVLSNPSGVSLGSVSDALLTIADAETAGQVGFLASTLTTYESFAPPPLVVTRTGGSQGRITVDYTVTGGTAIPLVTGDSTNKDYLDLYGTLSFGDGQTTASIPLTTYEDALGPNGSRTIELTLGNPTGGATLGAVTETVVTISDDDSAGALRSPRTRTRSRALPRCSSRWSGPVRPRSANRSATRRSTVRRRPGSITWPVPAP